MVAAFLVSPDTSRELTACQMQEMWLAKRKEAATATPFLQSDNSMHSPLCLSTHSPSKDQARGVRRCVRS